MLPLSYDTFGLATTQDRSATWVGSVTLEYVNYVLWSPEQSRNVCLLFICSSLHLENLGEVRVRG